MDKTRQTVNAKPAVEVKGKKLRHSQDHWWIEVNGELMRRATKREVKHWLVAQLLQGLAAI